MDKPLNMLKVALGVVLLGGGSAFTAGTLASKPLESRFAAHEILEREQRTEIRAEVHRAHYEAQWSRLNTEAILRAQGIRIPEPPAPVKDDSVP